MKTLGIASVLLLLLTQPSRAAPRRYYVTEFGRRVLTGSDQIVVARVGHLQHAFRGITTAHLEVQERLHGFDREPKLVLMYVEDLVAPDAFGSRLENSTVQFERRRREGLLRFMKSLPDGPGAGLTAPRRTNRQTQSDPKEGVPSRETRGVRLAPRDEGLFFLQRKGATYALVGFVSVRDPLYKAKRERIEQVLRLESIPALDVRANDAKLYFLRSIEDSDPWVRGNSAREIMSLALRSPDLFKRAEVQRLVRLLDAEKDVRIAYRLERAVRAVSPDAAYLYAVKAEARERELVQPRLEEARVRIDSLRDDDLRAADLNAVAVAYGRASTVLLSIYLADESPVVRERAARAIAEYGGPSARLPVREALATESETAVARALVFACGVGRDPRSVPILAERLSNPGLERPILYALANIGTPEARRQIELHAATASPQAKDLIRNLKREENQK